MIKYGMSPDLFWTLTPYQCRIWIDAKIERISEQQKKQTMDQVWLAYHIANWTRAKRMPNWDMLLTKMNLRERQIQTPKDMIRIAEMLTVALGGKDLRKKDMD